MLLHGLRTPAAPTSYDEAARASAAVIIGHYSTSFGWATRLLHEPVRTDVRSIYALVRVADELVDDDRQPWDAARRAALLDGLQEETHRALVSGGSANLVVHAFTLTATEHGISRALVDPFFDSMRADLTVQVHDRSSLDGYLYGSAEVVGLMCLRVFVDGDDRLYSELAPGARHLGAAFQKLNFLRDLHADQSRLGRTYLPGTEPAAFTDRERDLLLDEVDADLATAAGTIPRLPRSSRGAVRAAHDLFAALSSRLRVTPAVQIARERVRVPDLVKAQILARNALGAR
ncbi:squalene/phytoene synthase family protein [Ornithinimicrobium sp. F0845]|uniref:phytoene/squalene synthase family protein n=1 Tax=Ornithinimicrobium sp. F0845 TaxID=2926412 RepID=UPI001FF2B452|nr:squalene/phytoene synthase family protein [Ornithinimicrobium sp. F0845]MCK0113090.1 squalene/phytoene synthase family protein [Ornithinimicrobium sp. F0845]